MTRNCEYLQLTYTSSELRSLVEEYISQQKAGFTFKGVCNYIAYWAMEEGKTMYAGNGIFESNEIQSSDSERVRCVLDCIVRDGRIKASGETYYVV